MIEPSGKIQVYTADRRLFPVAEFACCLRLAAQGRRVLVAQLLRGGIGMGPSKMVRLLERMEWVRPDLSRVIDSAANDKELEAVQALWRAVLDRLERLDFLLLDEAGLAVQLGLLSEQQLIDLVQGKPPGLEVVLTGPAIPEAVVGLAHRWTFERPREDLRPLASSLAPRIFSASTPSANLTPG